MHFDEYQDTAKGTDQFKDSVRALASAIWSMTETVGALARLYDEQNRSSIPEKRFQDGMCNRLGDMLWYVSTVARHLNLKLSAVASTNIEKIETRWGVKMHDAPLFDEDFPSNEQFPREITFLIKEFPTGVVTISTPMADGFNYPLGDRVTDNAHEDDGYRYHDIFHLAYVAKLGWSPVVRRMLKRKRKSSPKIDEVEDGARAGNIEEGLTALVFEEARRHNFFEDIETVQFELLRSIERLVRGLEVRRCTYEMWNDAILLGYAAFRDIRKNKGGILTLNLEKNNLLWKDI